MRYLCILFLACFVVSCSNDKETSRPVLEGNQVKDALARINKVLVTEDREQIEGFVKRNKLDGIKETETGLFYVIWGEPNGAAVKTGNLVEYSFKVSLLDGTICYESKPDSLGTFVVGRGGVESGLEQGILMMKQGQKAKFIMPPHLAHGLIGDAKRIPARAIIVYDIELFKVNP